MQKIRSAAFDGGDFIGEARVAPERRPLVLVTHMEHHSNHTSWYETVAEVVVVPPDEAGIVDLAALDELLHPDTQPSALRAKAAASTGSVSSGTKPLQPRPVHRST